MRPLSSIVNHNFASASTVARGLDEARVGGDGGVGPCEPVSAVCVGALGERPVCVVVVVDCDSEQSKDTYGSALAVVPLLLLSMAS